MKLEFLKKYRPWIIIIAAFSAVRILLFTTFWEVSKSMGGWQNFYQQAYAFGKGPMTLFHEYCDWHPPLYYVLNSAVLYIFNYRWSIYFIQFLIALVCLFVCYRLARQLIGRRLAYFVTLILAIEPLWAWQFLLYTSENLSIPLFVASVYFFVKYLNTAISRQLVFSAIFLGLATLTRPNYLLLSIILPSFLIGSYFFRKRFLLESFYNFGWKKIVTVAICYFLIFGVIIAPWVIRNGLVYKRFTLANIVSTNMYFYNLPVLISWQKGVSYTEAFNQIAQQAQSDLGENVGDQGDCQKFSLEDFNRDLDYYSSNARKYILANLQDYTYIHLIKMTPFFFQSGYFEIWSAYTGVYNKPDFSTLMLHGDWSSIFSVFWHIDAQMFVHLLGALFWGLCSLSLLAAMAYSYFYDRRKFVYFLLSFMIIMYSALLVSPFVTGRYRLPVYVLFIVAFVYVLDILAKFFRKPPRKVREFVKKIPFIALPAKILQERLRENNLNKQIKDIASLESLPYENELPPKISLGHEPTIRCNLLCKMCYQRENRANRREEVPTDQVLNFYRKFSDKISEVKLVGGEPMVYQGIFELIDYWNGNEVPIVLQTNCTLLGRENIEKLKKFNKLKAVLTSLDGPEDLHDSIRGVSGSYQRLKTAIELIRKEMPQVEISAFATLLIDENLDSLFDLVKTAKKLNLTGINVLFEQFYSSAEVSAAKRILLEKFDWEDGKDYRLNTQSREITYVRSISPRRLRFKLLMVRLYGLIHGIPVNFTPFNYYDNLSAYLGLEPARPFCHKLLNEELRINQAGDVIWCDIIEKSFGNLNENTLEDIWLSDNFQNFRRFLHRQSLPICYRCCKASYLKK